MVFFMIYSPFWLSCCVSPAPHLVINLQGSASQNGIEVHFTLNDEMELGIFWKIHEMKCSNVTSAEIRRLSFCFGFLLDYIVLLLHAYMYISIDIFVTL